MRLAFYPWCDGTVIDILAELRIGDISVSHKYKVKWDDPIYGSSYWVTSNDLQRLLE